MPVTGRPRPAVTGRQPATPARGQEYRIGGNREEKGARRGGSLGSGDIRHARERPLWGIFVSEGRLHQKTIACSRQSSPLVTWPDDVSGTSGRASTPILSSAATARPGQFGPNGAGASSPVGGSPRAGRARQGTGAPRGGDRASPDPGSCTPGTISGTGTVDTPLARALITGEGPDDRMEAGDAGARPGGARP